MFLNITLIVSLALITTAPFVYSLTCHCTTDPDEHTASADKEMLIEDRVAADEAEALQLVAQMKCLNQLCQVKETVWSSERILQASCVISESPEGEVQQSCQYNPQFPKITSEHCPVTPAPSNYVKFCVTDRCNTNVNCTTTTEESEQP